MGSLIAVAGILVNCEFSLLNVWAKCFLSKGIIEKLLLESIKSLMCRVLDIQSCRGVGDKPMSCKPGVAGSIPGFS